MQECLRNRKGFVHIQIYVARSTKVRSASLVACFRRQGKLFGYVVLSPAEQSFAFAAGTGTY